MNHEPINFQDFELKVQDEEAPLTDPGIKTSVRRGFIPGMSVKNGKAVLFDREPSWIQELTWAIEDSGKKVEELPFGKYAHRFLDLIGLSHDAIFILMAHAMICDLPDPEVDWKMPDPEDRWVDHIRYPRLSHLAQERPNDFREFQSAMAKYLQLPDLASNNPPRRTQRRAA